MDNDAWEELRGRLVNAVIELDTLANMTAYPLRVLAKKEGVKLALSYMDDMRRG